MKMPSDRIGSLESLPREQAKSLPLAPVADFSATDRLQALLAHSHTREKRIASGQCHPCFKGALLKQGSEAMLLETGSDIFIGSVSTDVFFPLFSVSGELALHSHRSKLRKWHATAKAGPREEKPTCIGAGAKALPRPIGKIYNKACALLYGMWKRPISPEAP